MKDPIVLRPLTEAELQHRLVFCGVAWRTAAAAVPHCTLDAEAALFNHTYNAVIWKLWTERAKLGRLLVADESSRRAFDRGDDAAVARHVVGCSGLDWESIEELMRRGEREGWFFPDGVPSMPVSRRADSSDG